MKSRVLGLYLLLPASLAMIAGCAQSDGAKDAQASAAAPESEQTGEAKAPLRSGSWSAGVPIPGAIGYGTPSLATFRGRMHMLHRGLRGNSIYMSTFRNGGWGQSTLIPNLFSRVTPALGLYGDRMFAVYPHHRTNRLLMSLFDGDRWSDGVECGDDLYSGLSPSLAYFNRNLYMGYRGLNGNQLYLSAFDGNRWGSPFQIGGAFSRVSPSLTAYGNRLNMFYPGVNNQLYLSAFDGRSWGSPYALSGMYAPWSPGLGIYQNALNAVYPMSLGGWGSGGYGLGWSQFDGRSWGAGSQIPGITASFAPALGLYGNGLNMVYPGAGNQLFWSSLGY